MRELTRPEAGFAGREASDRSTVIAYRGRRGPWGTMGSPTLFHVETEPETRGSESVKRVLPGALDELDRAVHPLGELARDREPETAPGRLRALDAVEAVEDPLDVLRGDAGPVVCHRQLRAPVRDAWR